MKSTTPLAVDDLVDLVAREMTEVASVDLTTHVLARLEPRPVASIWLRLAAGGGVAAAALVMLVLWWPRSQPPLGNRVASPAELVTTTTAPGPETVVADRLPIESRALRSPGISAEDAAWLARAVPPLPPTPPISIDPIQPVPLSIAPISVQPLDPQAIEVPAIDVRNSGGR
ncbi:MAG TPA: hypothetical protein VN700_10055 [Vicinamibacterales bacterium]|nr:hypothetical protein [Vicinamibacterales bacterium]